MPDIEFPTSHGPTPGYLARPAGEQGPATIVLQEWWGLDSHIRSVCDRFAAAGFFALAPDLYRGETAEGPDEAQQKMMALSMETVEKDMCGAAEFLDSLPGVQGPEVGSVGFCLGGGLSVWAAATCPNIGAAVTFYYVMPHGKPDFSKITGPLLGHFGTSDEFITGGGSEGARTGAPGRRREGQLPVLRERRPRLLQRHQPPRDLRPGGGRAGVGTDAELPPRGAGRLSARWTATTSCRLTGPRTATGGTAAAGP